MLHPVSSRQPTWLSPPQPPACLTPPQALSSHPAECGDRGETQARAVDEHTDRCPHRLSGAPALANPFLAVGLSEPQFPPPEQDRGWIQMEISCSVHYKPPVLQRPSWELPTGKNEAQPCLQLPPRPPLHSSVPPSMLAQSLVPNTLVTFVTHLIQEAVSEPRSTPPMGHLHHTVLPRAAMRNPI